LNSAIINNLQPFIIDSEIIPVNGSVTDERVKAANQLNVVSSILQYLPEESHRIQETNPLKNIAFDCLMFDNQFLYDKPLKERLSYLHKIVKLLQIAGFRIELVPQKDSSMTKEQFYYSIVDNDGEGVIAKNLNDTYDILGKRDGRWVKLKRSVQETMIRNGQDSFDAFVSGFTLGTPGTKNEGKIGALIFSVYLTDDEGNLLYHEDGNPVIHEIAQISGISDELRDMLTHHDSDGNVMLNPRFYNQVASINGQDVSSRELRLMHPVMCEWRLDRSFNTCLVKKSLLESMVM
jgi:ATP-dependent DNA ligase